MAVKSKREAVGTIWEALSTWAREVPQWQQFVIKTAANQLVLSKQQIEQAYGMFLDHNGLSDGRATDVPMPGFERPTTMLAEKLVLERIDEIVGANALPSGAKLTFRDGLTVIYGENGAGKTGFCRLLANVCFSRQRPEILSNIYRGDSNQRPAARFTIRMAGEAREPVFFPSKEAGSDLRRITVFDAGVARHHLTQNAPFNFKPVGFDVFPEIGRVYDALSEMLEKDIAAKTRANEFPNSFAGNKGVVFETVKSLGATTDLGLVRRLAQYGTEESDRIETIEQEVSRLRGQTLPESRDTLAQSARDVADLSRSIASLELRFTSEEEVRRRDLVVRAKEAASASASFGSDAFKRAFFVATGGKEWESFVQAAHGLAKAEAEDYPSEDARCLLCEQKLDRNAVEHINALFRFVEGDLRKAAAAAQRAVDTEVSQLQALRLDVFSAQSRVRELVHKRSVELEAAIVASLDSIDRARAAALLQLQTGEPKEHSVSPSGIVQQLDDVIHGIEKAVAEAAAEKVAAAIETLEDEKRVLRHRQVLAKLLPQVEKYVADAAWVAKATACKPTLNTRPVTDKEKAFSELLITPAYRARLAEECRRLDCKAPVELRTKGDRGETVRGLAMPGGHKPDSVLSEGEQKAIALADFLTEVALNPAAAGIVLDDPVTSQDFRRKQRIAERLVLEARDRQVIIFTHDLVFLTQLCTAARDAEVEVLGHWVEQDHDGNPGNVTEGDLPVTSRHYRNTERAERCLAEARIAQGSAREDSVRKGMGALRTTLEETVVYRVFKDVVPRWNDRVIVTALKKVKWDAGKIDEIVALYEEISAFIEGHSHSDEARGPALVKQLESKIAEVTALIGWSKSDR